MRRAEKEVRESGSQEADTKNHYKASRQDEATNITTGRKAEQYIEKGRKEEAK